MSSIHAMSDDEFEEFEFESAHWDEVTEYDNELSCSVESRDEWIESGLIQMLETQADPDNEDNYDECCEVDPEIDLPPFDDDELPF